jgi:hypothetical protein
MTAGGWDLWSRSWVDGFSTTDKRISRRAKRETSQGKLSSSAKI